MKGGGRVKIPREHVSRGAGSCRAGALTKRFRDRLGVCRASAGQLDGHAGWRTWWHRAPHAGDSQVTISVTVVSPPILYNSLQGESRRKTMSHLGYLRRPR